jgi:hypothetical protein
LLPSLTLVVRASVMRPNADPYASRRPRPALDAALDDMVEISARFLGSQENGWVAVPVGFAKLPIDQQHELGLRIVHHGVLKLAQALGWQPSTVITWYRCARPCAGTAPPGSSSICSAHDSGRP